MGSAAAQSHRFDIVQKLGWEARNNVTATPTRAADIYVFCVFTARERAGADPLEPGQ